ncbi:hypothetical protein [Halalkalibacter nanhaiisediminis]|uniref:Uncharacterized protein n=1 Tax=Halalkalibacter nanhaiisediminis TaxID=688079 RepID=A0A562QKK4_9BACI|nr:hypothetical protein [Halalkalibacter nanhaiisediminis]TWI57203.1 hypothetical protein IQ10_01909 [Halalkalibacter nanhaiisediminis]
MSKHSRSKRAIQQGKDAVQPANETEGLNISDMKDLSLEQTERLKHPHSRRGGN